MQKNEHSFQIDVIRVIAIFGVLFIHLTYPIYSRPDFFEGGTWWIANIFSAFSKVSIPFFVMVSGYLLLGKQESIRETYKRTFFRLVVPLLSWFVIYLSWDYFLLGKSHSLVSILSMLLMSSMYHLYFLVMLIGLYILLPTFRLMVQRFSTKYLFFLAVLGIVSGMFLNIMQYFLQPHVSIVNAFTIWFPYCGYFLLGYLLPKYNTYIKRAFIYFFLFFFITIGLGYLNMYFFQNEIKFLWLDSGVSFFDQYLSPNAVALSITLYYTLIHASMLKKIGSSSIIRGVFREMAAASFGVYLVHFIIIDYVDLRMGYAIQYLTPTMSLLKYFFSRSFLVILWSFLYAFVMRRIPYIKMIVGEK